MFPGLSGSISKMDPSHFNLMTHKRQAAIYICFHWSSLWDLPAFCPHQNALPDPSLHGWVRITKYSFEKDPCFRSTARGKKRKKKGPLTGQRKESLYMKCEQRQDKGSLQALLLTNLPHPLSDLPCPPLPSSKCKSHG